MIRQKLKYNFNKLTVNVLLGIFLILYIPYVNSAQRNYFKDNTPYILNNSPIADDSYTFEQMGARFPIKLEGNLAKASIDFGSRLDEIITSAKLELSYIYSPALSPDVSHVKVLLNNQIAGFIPIEPNKGGIRQNKIFELDSRYLTKYNEISFEFVAYRNINCASPALASMWFEIDNQSKLNITSQAIPIQNDFSHFPKPFFDISDFSSLEIPFIFPENGRDESIEAAGIIASYFGSLAKWQGLSFPVLINELSNKHAIVFATNSNRPDFIKDYPVVDKPTVQLITHPNNPYIKLLLILGRDKSDLRTAIEGLTTGSTILAGSYAEINNVNEITPRVPYDAPYWLQTDREIHLQELIQNPKDLQVNGRTPPEIAINFNIAPDLFTWRSRGIPLNIRYRYSPIKKGDDSQLSIKVNDLFIQGYPLTEKGVGDGSEYDKLRIPFVDDLVFGVKNEILIPGFRLGAKNKIQFEFKYTKPEDSNCTVMTSNYMYGEIDADSTLDLRGFPHYMAMPDLKSFANLGFPFTRLADLSDTAIYLPKNPTINETQAYLEILGAMGSSTGVTATKFTLFNSAPFDGIEKKDLLIIGLLPADLMPKADEKEWPNTIVTEIKKSITLPMRVDSDNTSTLVQPNSLINNREAFKQVEFDNKSHLGALIGFESPWHKNKSAIAVIATESSQLKNITSILINKQRKISGTATFFKGEDIISVQEGKTYFIGELPLHKLIWFHFADSPILLAFLTLLMTGLIILVIWRLLKYAAYVRLHRFDD